MSQKEKKDKEEKIEEVTETPVEVVEKPEEGEQAEAEIEALQKQLEEAQAKAAENLDGWQRAQAEFINYKNRVQRDREMDYRSMKADIIRKMLPVLDDMQRALANRPDGDSWASGMELIVRKFQNILDAEGVKRIEAAGQPFDPNFHEAISSEPNEDVESGHVIEVVENGYMLGERVIRPARVRVAQ
ncbi:MAG: nucleotide exchange factor GrpE [Anaerolineales bacterium]|jgi:molecular chaperone GrpE